MDSKPWYLSVTVWGALGTILQAMLIGSGKMDEAGAGQIVQSVGLVLTSALSIYGRFRATKALTK